MSLWKNIQMVITTALLLLASVCPLFEEDIRVPYLFTLRPDLPGTAPHQLPAKGAISTIEGDVSEENEENRVNEDFLYFEMMQLDSLSAPAFPGKLKIALAGVFNFNPLAAETVRRKSAGAKHN